MNSFKEYFDKYLDPAHKGSYSEVWFTQGARSWYYLRVPRMRTFTNARMDNLISGITRNKFSKIYKLDSHDDAIWNLLNILFAIDPDFDSDRNPTLAWAEETLKKIPSETPAIDQVRLVFRAATMKYRNVTIPAVVAN
jgi:hypothetical protein